MWKSTPLTCGKQGLMRLSTICPLRVQLVNHAKSKAYEVKWRTIRIFLQDVLRKFLCINTVRRKAGHAASAACAIPAPPGLEWSRQPSTCEASMTRTPDPDLEPGDEAKPGTPGTGEDLCEMCGGSGKLE